MSDNNCPLPDEDAQLEYLADLLIEIFEFEECTKNEHKSQMCHECKEKLYPITYRKKG